MPKRNKLNLEVPQNIYQKLQSLAIENNKTIAEMAVELLRSGIGRQIKKSQKEKIANYLEDLGGERINVLKK